MEQLVTTDKVKLKTRIAELEEKIRCQKAVIHFAEYAIKSNMERKNAARRKPMDYAARKHLLNTYDVRIRQKRFHLACAEADIHKYQTELEKLKAHLPEA